MAHQKGELERLEALRQKAVEIAIKGKALKRCPRHDQVTLDQLDDEAMRAAFAIGTKRSSAVGRREMLNAIDEAIKDSPVDCPDCEHERDK